MSQSPPKPRRRAPRALHFARRGLVVVVLLWVIAGAYFYWRYWDPTPEHVAASAPQQPVSVDVLTVERETVPVRMRFLGQTEPKQLVEIRARVAGYLEERAFIEGQLVEKGQKLFQIDPRPFEVEVAQAQAGLASAEARLQRAQQQLARYEGLTVQGAVTEGELDDWRTQRLVAQADVLQNQALIAAAELQLDYASIESPIRGMIGQAMQDTGSYVDAGANSLLAVVQQVDPIYVRYAVTEQEVLRFNRQVEAREITSPDVGELELEVALSDGSTYPYRGRINFVDVQVDETTGTSVIRGEVPNPNGMLKPGQFIYATVLGVERIGVVRVPQGAVTQGPEGASVMVVNPENVAETRPVKLGQWSGSSYWIVEEGLTPGDRIITSRLMMVQPGSPVSIAAEQTIAEMVDAEQGTDEPLPEGGALSATSPENQGASENQGE